MFTGLIQKIGRLACVSRTPALSLRIACDPWSEPLRLGESIAVNGVCLTVTACDHTHFTADVLAETERRSTLGSLLPGARLNLERALRVGDRLGGHFVQGHVDGRGVVREKRAVGRDMILRVHGPRAVLSATVLKGSITVNGVSLTVSARTEAWFEVNIIPTTARETNLGTVHVGDEVNLESDVLTRSSQGAPTPPSHPTLTWEKLAENGFL